MFRCESILLRSHWVMVVMDVFTRRFIGFGVHAGDVDGVAACRMFNSAVGGQPLPKHVSTDHDPLFCFHHWRANLRVLEIEEVKSVPYAPTSHPFVERLIGTARREFLDRVFFWNSSTWHESWRHSEIITMHIACIDRLEVPRPITALVYRLTRLLRSNIILGDVIAAGCFRLRWRRDCEFATNSLATYCFILKNGAPGRIRTSDPLVRRPEGALQAFINQQFAAPASVLMNVNCSEMSRDISRH